MHKLELHALYLCLLGLQSMAVCVHLCCFVLLFLAVLSVSVYGARVCVDVVHVRGSSVFVGERILGEVSTRCVCAPADMPGRHLLVCELTYV